MSKTPDRDSFCSATLQYFLRGDKAVHKPFRTWFQTQVFEVLPRKGTSTALLSPPSGCPAPGPAADASGHRRLGRDMHRRSADDGQHWTQGKGNSTNINDGNDGELHI